MLLVLAKSHYYCINSNSTDGKDTHTIKYNLSDLYNNRRQKEKHREATSKECILHPH